MARKKALLDAEITALPPLTVRKVGVMSTFEMGDGHPRTEDLKEDLETLYGAMGKFVSNSRRMKSHDVEVAFFDGFSEET